MRAWLAAVGALTMIFGAGSAGAAESPWCTEFDVFTKSCAYASQKECLAVAKSVGATCVANPEYHPPAPVQRKSAHKS